MSQILAYRTLFEHLLPQGPIWQKNDPLLRSYAVALGDELDMLYQKFQEMKYNLEPQHAVALLPEWEADTDLPDHCLQYSDHDTTRQENLLMRLYEREQSHFTWLNQFLAKLDPFAKAEETDTATVTISHSQSKSEYARTGKARAGQALLNTLDETALPCHLQQRLPADVKLIFRYLTTPATQ